MIRKQIFHDCYAILSYLRFAGTICDYCDILYKEMPLEPAEKMKAKIFISAGIHSTVGSTIKIVRLKIEGPWNQMQA